MKNYINYIKEINEIDPYSEENWGESSLDNYWNLVSERGEFINKSYEKIGDVWFIEFYFNYPIKGFLGFGIYEDVNDDISLFSLESRRGIDVILKEPTYEEILNKIKLLIENYD